MTESEANMKNSDIGISWLIIAWFAMTLIGIFSQNYWIAGIVSGYLLLPGPGYLVIRNVQKLEDAKMRLVRK